MRRSFLLVLPIAVLIALAVLLARGLQSDPRKLDSVLIGKPRAAHRLANARWPSIR